MLLAVIILHVGSLEIDDCAMTRNRISYMLLRRAQSQLRSRLNLRCGGSMLLLTRAIRGRIACNCALGGSHAPRERDQFVVGCAALW